jgi:hypothetical protein
MKTYKRELAIAVRVWFMYVVEVKDVNIVELLVWPVFTFAALAFGLDWFGKSSDRLQGTVESLNGGRTQRSSERPDGEDSNPNDR